ncbi:MAG: glycogen synthase [Actinomycetota bacterium]|nr:glycogen synthase [Euzebyales bacterium]MDQ3451122.1 glycogen synthase [Actinomycetota bacterium]
MTLRAALLTREYPPEVYGGAGVHVEYLARELAHHVGVAVHAFGPPRDDPLVAGAYQPWEELVGGGPHMAALRTMSVDLAMAAAVEGADVVHSHTWYANLAGHLAKLLYGVPHVVTTHSLEPLRPWKAEQLGGGYALSSFCERTALEAADLVIAVSAQMRRDVLACYPAVGPERVAVVHNGIDLDEYRRDPGTEVLRRHGIDPDRPSVVFVGRITRQKGLVHLLEAATHLRTATQLVLCAGAPDTPQIAAEVTALVERLRASRDGLVWIDAMLPRAEVVQILSHATVFVCPSVYEPFGLVNVEAMACEAPVVATRVGGIPEVVSDGETGLLVDIDAVADPQGTPRDPVTFARTLAAAVNALLDNPAQARAMGAAGRRRVEAHFSWSAIAARTAQLYKGLA